jgi:DNA-binding SARP family transcriptional activator
LGPLRIVDGGTVSSISARKMEVLLAALLVRGDQIVSIDQLIAEIWGERPPRRATAALHVYISQLRKLLRRPGDTASRIATRPAGYQLLIGDDEMDLREFQALVNRGRQHVRQGSSEDAVEDFQAALGLWHGGVVTDAGQGSPIVSGFATWIEEQRLETVEMLIDTSLALGRHRELVGQLYSLIAEYPMRESFHRQLMLALYRSERQADALDVYHSARDILNERLGLEPCRALRELHQALLMADDHLELPAAV